MSNSLGRILKLTTFGESHGEGLGFILDGFPAGVSIDIGKIEREMARRKPGQSKLTSQRKENDGIKILSGIKDGISLGTPISVYIENRDKKSKDYDHLEHNYRPGHADYTYEQKYGIREHRGGGRSSARETANWVAAGAIAAQLLDNTEIQIHSFVKQIGNISTQLKNDEIDYSSIDSNMVRCPDQPIAEKMISHLESVRKEGDTLGGIIRCVVKNMPIGLGEPVFNKLQSALAQAMMSINAAKGFQYGSGFESAQMKGSEHNDIYEKRDNVLKTKTNNAGGIQGGISNGENLYFDVAFKPISTIMKDQPSVNDSGEEVILKGKGRHDPCVVPRAVPIVDALTAFVLADFYLLSRISKI
ncbi:chorismate synthase [Hyphobacterium sp. CCMP332]|nr:chorismate synthase [Hyphobacterium sp. CCMP332]